MDDKKKTMILALLLVVMGGVGAFSFLGGGGEQAPESGTPVKKPSEKAAEEKEKKEAEELIKKSTDGHVIKNPQYANDLSERNPFKPGFELNHKDPPKPDPTKVASSTTLAPSVPAPAPLPGGSLDSSSRAPSVAPVKPPEPVFGYQVRGVVIGARPAAVFADSSGAQRIISQGGSIDGDSRVVEIEKGRVVVLFRGKYLTLSVGGN